MRITVPRLLLFILFEVLALIVLGVCLRAQEAQPVPPTAFTLPPPTDVKLGPQIVLIVDHSRDDKKYVVPNAVVMFQLSPLAGPTAKAPLATGDTMICQAFDMKDQSGGMHIAERCGPDLYLITTIGVYPPPDKKKR